MLRVTLTANDLDRVRVAPRPAPMLELRTLMQEPLASRAAAARPDRARTELIRSLVAQPCAPGFLFAAASDPDDAVETVIGTHRDVVRRDLEDNLRAGFPLPAWTTDLTRPGHAGVRARRSLHAALEHVTSAYVEPRTRWAGPTVEAAVRAWREVAAARGVRAMLNGLHPAVRCRGSVLEVDLASGADVAAATTGAGIRVVPTLSGTPGVTVSSEGDSPLVLTCPVPSPDRAPWATPPPDPALADLVGPSRSMLLGVIASRPGQGTRALARRCGLAPASASEHLAILRRAGLVEGVREGTRLAHRPTPLGWSLLLRPTR